jgi:sulfite exporter TauE/SafE/copper chaperone CopZ
MKETSYSVKGMHCASCELLIEKKILELNGVKSAEAKTSKGEVFISYEGEKPSLKHLNEIFSKENYVFSDKNESQPKPDTKGIINAIIIATVLIIGFLFINKLGIAGIADVSSKSSLPSFFVLGILAGFSSCAALVGGLVLSMSKQWLEIYPDKTSTFKKIQPHLIFNSGRIISYGVLGAVLGLIGNKIQISFQFTSLLIFAVSFLMIVMALQMLGFRYFQKFQFTLPKSTTRYISDEKNFKGKYMPFIMGALTFFLPCGFTITAQGLALLSGNMLSGGLIMAMFALGTAPALLLIGLSSVKFSEKPHMAFQFSRVAGILILFFALFNLNNQLNVLGVSNLSDIINNKSDLISEADLPQIVNGKQVIKMEASASGYSPNNFKVRVNVPVRWEITDIGTSGCTNKVISAGLFSDSINLTHGQTSIKEFTPTAVGRYKFSCWMGMVSGIIEVVDPKNPTSNSGQNSVSLSNEAVPSGASGCGCSK